MQRRKCVDQRLHIDRVERRVSLNPLPLIVGPADQALFVVGEESEPVNLLRLECKDSQILPLQRIDKNIIED